MGAFCFLGASVPLSLIVICLITVEQSGHLIKVVSIFFLFCTCLLRLSESIWSAFNQSGAEVTSCYLTSYLCSWLYRQYWPRLSNKTSLHTPRPLHCLIFERPISSKPDILVLNGLSLKFSGSFFGIFCNLTRMINKYLVIYLFSFMATKCLQVKVKMLTIIALLNSNIYHKYQKYFLLLINGIPQFPLAQRCVTTLSWVFIWWTVSTNTDSNLSVFNAENAAFCIIIWRWKN